MREETAREFLAAVERGFELMEKAAIKRGFEPTKTPAADMMARGARLIDNLPQRLQAALQENGTMGFLLAIPEPSPEEKSNFIAFAKNLPFLLREPFKKFGSALPYKRKGGKPPAFDGNPEIEQQACVDVGILLGQGYEKVDALAYVANKHKTSTRTMRRAYNKWLALQRNTTHKRARRSRK